MKNKITVISSILFSLTSVSAHALTFNYNDNLALDLNARLQFSALNFSDDYYPNLDGFKHSFIAITPYYKINNAYIGATYVGRYALDTSNNLRREDNAKFSSSQYYVFVKSPELGQTSIGKTSGVLEDFFLGAQNFGISSTNFLPLSLDVYHQGMWKYVSSKNKYYDYGFSFVHNAKSDYGAYSQIAGNINWNFSLSERQNLKVLALYGSQKQVVTDENRFKTHPYALGLAYSFDKYFEVKAVGYRAHERVYNFAESTNYKNNVYGVIYSLNVKPVDYLDLYARYIYNKVDNKNEVETTSLSGVNVASNNSFKQRVITYGASVSLFKYGFVYVDHSRILENASNDANTTSYNFTQVGWGVQF
ncbi:hypothetical protein CJP74_06360 [Psittacicella melopsittaci]|uniref:Porin n=1 Tax=Psittacicella melopsittaci TaxID=2028576 RepID=A0A3A1Y3B1_9GAMM|nr:hypothetical protein [Psittacicella melopsittaci]RIY31789.1 hypothetical protein CJP74_06360 [Psittacicella melopsittaci]